MEGVIKPARNLPVPNVQQKTPDDGQRRCPKRVEFYNRINLNNNASGWLLKRKIIYDLGSHECKVTSSLLFLVIFYCLIEINY